MKYMAHYHYDLCEGSDGDDVWERGERKRGSERANAGARGREEKETERIGERERERERHEGSSSSKFVTK